MVYKYDKVAKSAYRFPVCQPRKRDYCLKVDSPSGDIDEAKAEIQATWEDAKTWSVPALTVAQCKLAKAGAAPSQAPLAGSADKGKKKITADWEGVMQEAASSLSKKAR